jgi:hypothetical protein
MKGLGLKYGVTGGVLSLIAFISLQNLFGATDVQGFILVGTIIFSTIICCCTGILIDTYQSERKKEKS